MKRTVTTDTTSLDADTTLLSLTSHADQSGQVIQFVLPHDLEFVESMLDSILSVRSIEALFGIRGTGDTLPPDEAEIQLRHAPLDGEPFHAPSAFSEGTSHEVDAP